MPFTINDAATQVNSTMKSLGYDYQIDTTSEDTIQQGFQAIGAFPPDMRTETLLRQQKILVDLVFNSMFDESKNPTRPFWRNDVNYGGAIQETFIQLIQAESGYWFDEYTGADPADENYAQAIMTDLVKAKLDNIKTKIHPINQKFRIKMSVSDLEISKVFTPQGYADYLNAKYANFAHSIEAQFMLILINQMKDMISNERIVFKSGYTLDTSDGVTSFVESLNTVSDGMLTLNSIYNVEGVQTTSEFDNLYLVINPEVYNRIKSRGYANAFNLAEYENKNRIIYLPAGTSLGNDPDGNAVGAMLVDRRAVLFSLRYWSTKVFNVANADYVNQFTQIQGISGDTGFFQAVAFGTGEVGNFSNAASSYIIVEDANGAAYESVITVDGKPLSDYFEFDGQFFDTEGAPYFKKWYKVPNNSFVVFDPPSDIPETLIVYYQPYEASQYQVSVNNPGDAQRLSLTVNGILCFGGDGT